MLTYKAPYIQITEALEKVFIILMLVVFLSVKIVFLIYANPLPDEAYYWLWSKKIALSYYDHPPLATWVQGLLLSFSDDKYFVIRALPVSSLGILLIIMVMWQRYIFNRFDFYVCLRNIVLFLAFPICAIFFSISFPDYLLITLLFASSFCIFLYFERNDDINNGIYYWYLAVLFFSLALLTKYNAILFGVGALIYILYHRKKLIGLSYGHIFVSAIMIFLIQTPVLLWNLNNDFSSFSFHLDTRLDQVKDPLNILRNIAGFLIGVLLAFSPIFIFSLKNNFFLESHGDDRKKIVTMGKFIFVFSVVFCLFLSFFTNVLYYWLTPAIVLLIPFLIDILRFKVWQYLHIAYGLFISLILLINISLYPVSAFFGNVDRETAILFGWDKIIEAVSKEKRERSIEKVIFSDYRLGSLYIFHSGDFEADVVMEERRTQFDIWRGQEKAFATNTLIVVDQEFPIGPKILLSFKSINFLKDIDIYKGNKFIKKYKIFIGINT